MAVAVNFIPVLPEIVILTSASLILLIDLWLPDDRRHISYWLTQLALLIAACVTLRGLHDEIARAFHDVVIADMAADVLRMLSFAALSLVLFYSRTYLAARGLFRGETFVLMLFALLGMQVLITANNFLTLYLGLELMSLALYALVALQRDRAAPAEAAMKYFVLGALASGILLYGMSMIYGATGSLQIDLVAQALSAGGGNHALLVFGLVFVVSAMAFKLGAVPYHMWVPDVYQGAPTAITLLIGTVPEFAAFAMLLRLLAGALGSSELVMQWQGMLAILALLSVTLGHVVAIAQSNLKRMLAYSTIANMGYVLMGFLGADANGYTAAMFYILAYVMTSLVSFGMILLLSREGFEADRIDDLKGLNQRSPWWAFVMLLAMFSLAGLPPTIGFYGKLMVLQSAVKAGYLWLAVVGVLAALVGAFYYLRIVKLMYFDDPVDTSPIVARGDTRWLLSGNALALLLFGILPQIPIGICYVALVQSRYF
ncbi:MAG TPA: NADH-quinone oxidoreductase subunit NuoN [Casimicrobiaceae bacterium]|nr:NADH-quinone oxidoreductase subunit NuoN [Casimicrobiaceae bacterium]